MRMFSERLEGRCLLSTTYYVALNGSDSNAGTDAAHPFATIQAGLNHATTAGDVVQVAGGIYRGQYNTHFVGSGSSGSPITLEAAPGATVIVDGAVPITGWARVGTSAVYTDANWNHYFAPQGSGTNDARSQPRDQLFVDGQYLPEVESLSALSPGTFYVDPGGTHAISVWLSDGSNPNNHSVNGTATDGPLLTTYNGSAWCSNLVINGLQFQDCANIAQAGASEVQINGGQNVTVENVTVQYAAGSGIGLNDTNCTVENCHFNHNGEEGIGSIGAVNLSVIDCETAYNNTLPSKQFDVIWEAGASKFGQSTNVVIDGLVSHDNYGDGLWFDYNNKNATIRNCVISNNYGYGIHYEISYSATIYNNVIFNNFLHYNFKSGVDGYGIFLSSSIGCVVYNNTIVGNQSIGFVSSGLVRGYFFSYANEFFNNIVVSDGPAVLMGDVSAATKSTVPSGTTLSQPYAYSVSDFNLFYNVADNPKDVIGGYYGSFAAWQAAGLDTHSRFADPLFADESNNLFQLSAGSPALKGGTTSWPGVSIHEANPQIIGAHFDTVPTASDFDNLPAAVIADTPVNTTASSVVFHLAFSEPVKNVTTSAFQLAATGTAAGTITAVSASSGSSFTVTVSSVSGVGSLRLDVLSGVIRSSAAAGKNVLGYEGGVAAIVPLAKTPAVVSIAPFTTGPTSSNFLQYVVTFNEPVTGIGASNFVVTATGTATGAIVPKGAVFASPVLGDGSGTTFEVVVGPTNIPPIVGDSTDTNLYPGQITGDGTLRLDFVDGSGNVKDASGNAVPGYASGVVADIDNPRVTLTAPADGGSTTSAKPVFSGSAGTASGDNPAITVNIYSGVGASGTPVQTLTTTASGGSYSVAATASLSPGTYTAQASQTDGANTTGLSAANVFTLAAATSGGLLSGVQSTPASSYNLTSVGTGDWAHWGMGGSGSAFDHKSSGGSQISNVTTVGAGGFGGYSDPSRTITWSDGAPVKSDAADHGYIWANNGIGAGYSFTVPAGTGTQTLYVYLGGYSSGSMLTAHLSDASAADYTLSLSGSALYSDIVAINYHAASAGQTLTLTYVKSQNINGTGGSADLIAAWLVGPAVSSAAVVTTNPTGQVLTVGQDASFTAAAGGSPTPTVQWLVETGGSASFTAIGGATSTTLDLGASTLAESGNRYEATFSNGVGSPATTTAATLTVNPAPSGGSVTGVQSTPASSYNLTAVGTSDWAHWGMGGSAGAFDRKATGSPQISNVTQVGIGGFGGYSDPSRGVSWTDGTPVSSDASDHGYIWANNGIGAGYSFTVPASTATQTLYVYLGGYSSGSTLTAHLSDKSAADYTLSLSGSALYSDVVALTYNAASAGQTLTLTYVKSQNINGTGGSADLIAAWMGAASVTSAPFTIGGPGVDASQFRVTTFANVSHPYGMVQLSDGSLLVGISTGAYFTDPGELIRLVDANHDGVADGPGTVLAANLPPRLTSIRQSGDLVFVGDAAGITILRKGATEADPYTNLGTLAITFPANWYEGSFSLEVRPTPGEAGSTDLFFNVGAQMNAVATPLNVTVGISDGSFSGAMEADSIYKVTVQETGGSVSFSGLQEIAAGLRNAAGMALDSATGDLYFEDNGINGPNYVPVNADELNVLRAGDIGGPVPDYGFPHDYIAYGGARVGSGAVQPLVAFQPLPAQSVGAAEITLSPSGFPAALRNGVFVGFEGNNKDNPDQENPVVFANPTTGNYFHFIESGQAGVGHLVGLMSTTDSLFLADLTPSDDFSAAGGGAIYQIQAK